MALRHVGSTECAQDLYVVQNFLNLTKAAAFLGIDRSTMRQYIKQGVFKTFPYGKRHEVYIRRQELELFKRIRHDLKIKPKETVQLLKGLHVRLQSIDEKIDFLMRICGLDVSTLRDADDQILVALYQEAQKQLEESYETLTPTRMEYWANVFPQLTELELLRMVPLCNEPHVWRVFHDLCTRCLFRIRRNRSFGENMRLQQTYRLLEKGRKVLGQAAVLFIDKHDRQKRPLIRSLLFAVEARLDSLDRYIIGAIEEKSSSF